MTNKFPTTLLMVLMFLVVSAPPSHALWWMVYHKPAYKGKVIDAETKEPIEGAVVAVEYSKEIFGFPAGGHTKVINVKETLTDKNGAFYFPSYTTLIKPLSAEYGATFIIFKPGYGSFPSLTVPEQRVSPPIGMSLDDIETFFSKETGSQGEMEVLEITAGNKSEWKLVKVTFGIVELPKLKTREERIKVNVSPVGEPSDWKKQKQFIKAIRDEWQYLTGEDPGELYINKK